jgi:serine protease inhibitor
MRGVSKLWLALALGLSACAARSSDEAPRDRGASSAAPSSAVAEAGETTVAEVARGNRAFALSLYRELAGESQDNLFFSPLSIATAFGPVTAGAAGETRLAIVRALHFPVAGEGLHPALAGLSRALAREGGDATLVIANALWVKHGFAILPAFRETARRDYGAQLVSLDFERNPGGAANAINAWVNERTRTRIPQLVEASSFDAATRLVITNAVYFLADWQAQFRPPSTVPRPFTLADGTTVETPMMHQTSPFRFHDGGRFTAIDLPYRDPRLSMTVLLPTAADGLPALERALTPELLDRTLQALDAASPERVELMLPRLELRTTYRLDAPLRRLGMAVAFTNAADFANITADERLAIDSVIHKTFLRVDEKGTEAAAATAVTIVATSAPAPPRLRFHADHPFLFMLRDRDTGALLFLGRIVRPES